RFAPELTQIVELSATDLRRADHVDFVDHARVNRENPFHAVTEADLAYSEAGLGTASACDYHPFKRLQPFLIPFFDFHVNAHGVAWDEIRKVIALRLRQQFFNN